MIVMKFGGTSVGSAEAMKRTISIIRGRLSERPLVVVSAMAKVTDMLYSIADTPFGKERENLISDLKQRHLDVISELLSDSRIYLNKAVSMVDDLLNPFPEDRVEVIQRGELLSSSIIACAMNAAGIDTGWADAREMMITEGDRMKASPVFDELLRRVSKEVDRCMGVARTVVTQGFIGKGLDMKASVLGRGGSDYSASLFAAALDARRIEIWTDVDGVKTADPRKVEGTRSLDKISFEQAAEMAHFGAKVLHPLTMEPAVMKSIPIFVLNSMNPSGAGTMIVPDDSMEDGVKSVSQKDNVILLVLSHENITDPSALMNKVFAVLERQKAAIDLMRVSDDKAWLTLECGPDVEQLKEDIGRIAEVQVDENVAQISVIGKNIAHLRQLLQAPIQDCKAYMVSYGYSYVNVCFVVAKESAAEITRELHKTIFNKCK